MKTIEEYAIGLVCEGAEACVEDDLNEDGEIGDEDHDEAADLAGAIVQVLRADPLVSFVGPMRLSNLLVGLGRGILALDERSAADG